MYSVQAWPSMRFLGGVLVASLLWAGCLDPTIPTGTSEETPGPEYEPVEPLGWAWRAAAPAPDPVAGAACSAFDGGLWVMGGTDENDITVPDVNVYDLDTDVWRRDASLPELRSGATATVVGGALQYVGGYTDSESDRASRSVLERNPLGLYVRGSDLPTPTARATPASLAGLPLLVGGSEGSEVPTDKILIWNPPFGWQEGGRLQEARLGAAVLALNGTHFIVAGGTGTDGPSASMYVQDLEGVRTTELPDVPTPRSDAATAHSKVRLFLLGGTDADGAVRASAEFYDVYAKAWFTLKGLPMPVTDACAVAMDDGVHVVGGVGGDGTVRAEHWVLVPELEVGPEE